jgi:hypothetical protein
MQDEKRLHIFDNRKRSWPSTVGNIGSGEQQNRRGNLFPPDRESLPPADPTSITGLDEANLWQG